MVQTEESIEVELGMEESKRAKHDAMFDLLKEIYKAK